MSQKTECIKVAIRCRPLSENEMKEAREIVVKMDKTNGEVIIHKPGDNIPKVFTFDTVYDWNTE